MGVVIFTVSVVVYEVFWRWKLLSLADSSFYDVEIFYVFPLWHSVCHTDKVLSFKMLLIQLIQFLILLLG